VLASGATVDRYVVREPITGPGPGLLCAAFDPGLGRLVELRLFEGPLEESALTRLQRRARLSHPHVAAVYDVGVFEGRTFVAQEHVGGLALADWLRTGPAWRDILGVLAGAARGLAALTSAQLWQGGLDATRIVVRPDRRACVIEPSAPAAAPDEDLWRAFAALATEALGADPRTPARVRRRVRRLLDRAAAPAATLEGLAQGLEALSRRTAARTAGAAALALAALAALALPLLARRSPCARVERKLARVWDAARKREGRAAFLRTGLPYAEQSWRSSERTLDNYARDWILMRTEACTATWVRRQQPADVLDLRMRCLDRRLDHLRALGELYTHADANLVAQSVRAAAALPGLDTCSNVRALRARVLPPEDLALQARVAVLEARLSALRTRERAGLVADAGPEARQLAAAADEIGWRPLQAEALDLLGAIEDANGDPKAAEHDLREAILAAEAGRHDEQLAEAWIELTRVVGYEQARFEDGDQAARSASAALERLGGERRLQLELAHVVGAMRLEQGRHEEAEAAFRRALALGEQLAAQDELLLATPLDDLGMLEAQLHKPEQALELHQRALRIRERVLGARHPDVSNTIDHIGGVYYDQGDFAHAATEFRRALELREQVMGPQHPDVATSLNNLSQALEAQGRYEDALALLRRALAISERVYGPQHPSVALCLNNIGSALGDQGRYREALDYFERALAVERPLKGEDHEDVAMTRANIGEALELAGRAREARPHLEGALAVFEQAGHPGVPHVQITLAEVELSLGQTAHARELAERALRGLEKSSGEAADAALGRFVLAQTLWGSGERARARVLARQARNEYARTEHHIQNRLSRMDGWLDARKPAGPDQ